MSEHNCIIGVLNKEDSYLLSTIEDLKEEIEDRIKFNEYAKQYDVNLLYKIYQLHDYMDKRKSTNLTRFDFCPQCGKKIEWKRMKDNCQNT